MVVLLQEELYKKYRQNKKIFLKMLDNQKMIGYNKKVSKITPFFDIYGLMVKRLRHRPFTAESGVRFPLRLPSSWICSNYFFVLFDFSL